MGRFSYPRVPNMNDPRRTSNASTEQNSLRSQDNTCIVPNMVEVRLDSPGSLTQSRSLTGETDNRPRLLARPPKQIITRNRSAGSTWSSSPPLLSVGDAASLKIFDVQESSILSRNDGAFSSGWLGSSAPPASRGYVLLR